MNERRSLHPVYILFGLLNTVKGFIPFIVIVLLKGADWFVFHWAWIAGAALLTAVILLYSFLDWKRFGFWLEEDRIIIRKGLLFRDEKTIYYGRIHTVNVEQPIVQRLLGVAQVKIETPGGNKKADGILPALSVAEAGNIQAVLRKYASAKQLSETTKEQGGTVSLNPADELAGMQSSHTSPSIRIQGNPIADRAADEQDEYRGAAFRLDAAQLLQAAATSMNFGLVAAFVAGLFSFADDFIEALLPEHFIESVVEDSASLMPGYVLVITIALIGIVFAWFLSLVLYVLKYSGFSVTRDGKQISVAYGLLEKKTFSFDPKKVQAVIVNEGLLRQAIGYAEVQLQVISSDKKEQLMLHPFVKRKDVTALLADFVPQLKLPSNAGMAGAPGCALVYYVRIGLLLAMAASTALIAWLGAVGLYSLLLVLLVVLWRISCYRAAGIKLADGQLTLRKRFISRTTYLIRRPQIVTMRVKRSFGQQRRNLLTVSVHAMGSPFDYRVACLDRKDVEPVWNWYSRSRYHK
ncbi:PH domain-containing protein [Paenibacillus sp. N4]|uniref:PH domain-containing protein n=1 Tax=Paenibacillus vietnamensis TaxID=2590547 RepID=UPI001CD0F8A4|nr:PH domain-containing protein [Paenibacillus vietnamensis]MCA0756780.1 PH domain-containing protein [Paenibacillus vietnamensis]